MRDRKTRYGGVLVGLMLGLCSGNMPLAWAQAKGPGAQSGKKAVPVTSDPVMTEFDKHLQAGKDAAKTNRWDTARQEFLKAHELKPDDAAAVAQLAQAEIATGRNRDAVEHLELFLAKPAGNDADRKVAERLLAEARSKLAIVTITVNKPGAKVSVDGRILGESPLTGPVPMDSGHRRFEAEGREGQARVDIDIEAGTKPTITLVLKAPKPNVIVQESPSWRTPLLLTGLGLGVVGIGVGAGFIMAAKGKDAEAEALAHTLQLHGWEGERSLCPSYETDPGCAQLDSLQKRRGVFADVATAGFIVGGVAAAGSVIILLATSKSSKASRNKETLLVVPSPQGVFVTGTF